MYWRWRRVLHARVRKIVIQQRYSRGGADSHVGGENACVCWDGLKGGGGRGEGKGVDSEADACIFAGNNLKFSRLPRHLVFPQDLE